jgi:hypothetical protein
MTWRERIVAAKERGRFTLLDRLEAAKWSTCAVGEQHAALPDVVLYVPPEQGYSAYPLDTQLMQLGSECPDGFSWAVQKDDIAGAESLLDRIEDRVLELKRSAGSGF